MQVDASNNAGDRPYHWAANMGHQHIMDYLKKVGFFSQSNFQGKALTVSSLIWLSIWAALD